MVSVLFVCLGNICRSPTAQGVFENLVEQDKLSAQIAVDSAGTSGWHIGEPPDRRAAATARKRGIELNQQRSRQVVLADFFEYDYILAMDEDNLNNLMRACPYDRRSHVQLFLSYAPQLGVKAVPDPYYGGARGFENVLDMIEEAAFGLLQHIKENDLAADIVATTSK